MRELLNSILQFRDSVDTLYNYSLLEAARLDSSRDHERVSAFFLVIFRPVMTDRLYREWSRCSTVTYPNPRQRRKIFLVSYVGCGSIVQRFLSGRRASYIRCKHIPTWIVGSWPCDSVSRTTTSPGRSSGQRWKAIRRVRRQIRINRDQGCCRYLSGSCIASHPNTSLVVTYTGEKASSQFSALFTFARPSGTCLFQNGQRYGNKHRNSTSRMVLRFELQFGQWALFTQDIPPSCRRCDGFDIDTHGDSSSTLIGPGYGL